MVLSDVLFKVGADRLVALRAPTFSSDRMAPIVTWTSYDRGVTSVLVAALHEGHVVEAKSGTTLCTVAREPSGRSPTAFGYLNESLPDDLVEAIASTGAVGVMVQTVSGAVACTLNGYATFPNITNATKLAYSTMELDEVGDVTQSLSLAAKSFRELEATGRSDSAPFLSAMLSASAVAVERICDQGTLSDARAEEIAGLMRDAADRALGARHGDAGLAREAYSDLVAARSALMSSVAVDLRQRPAKVVNVGGLWQERGDRGAER